MGLLGPTLSNTALAADPVAQQAGVPVVARLQHGERHRRDRRLYLPRLPLRGAGHPVHDQGSEGEARPEEGGDHLRHRQRLHQGGLRCLQAGRRHKRPDNHLHPDVQRQRHRLLGPTDRDQGLQPGRDHHLRAGRGGEHRQAGARTRHRPEGHPSSAGTASTPRPTSRTAVPQPKGRSSVRPGIPRTSTPENTKFIAAYKAQYNADPDQFAAQAYTGVYIYAAALKSAGANVDRKGAARRADRDQGAGDAARLLQLPVRPQRRSPAGGAGGHEREVRDSEVAHADANGARRHPRGAGAAVAYRAGRADGRYQLVAADPEWPLRGERLRPLRRRLYPYLRRAGHPQPRPSGDLHARRVHRTGLRDRQRGRDLGRSQGGFQLPFWLATILAMLVAGLLGILLDRMAFAPLRKRPDTHFSGMVSSIAVALIFEAGGDLALPATALAVPCRDDPARQHHPRQWGALL